MTTTTPIGTESQSTAARALRPLAAMTTIAVVALSAFGIWADGTPGGHDESNTTEFLVTCALGVLTAGLVFGWLVPRGLRRPNSAATALTMSAIGALLVVPVFWSGVPLVLGVGGALLGWAGRDAARGTGKSQAAVILGVLTVVAVLAIYVLDWMSTNGVI